MEELSSYQWQDSFTILIYIQFKSREYLIKVDDEI